MEKVKQEVFSNFNYGIIKSIDNRCVDVKCTYNYKGKTLTHYFSYAKQGNKPNSYYIERAKADMSKLTKEKKAETVAKKDLNGSKATFFKRHKKPILVATTAVLVAGIATAATLITLKYTRDSTAVTEAEIDVHTKFPSGELTLVEDEDITNKIIKDSIASYNDDGDLEYSRNIDNVTSITLKGMGSYKSKKAYGEDGSAEIINEKKDLNGNSVSSFNYQEETPYNDTTGYNTNNSFKTKKLQSMYVKADLKNDPYYMHTHMITTYDDVIENVAAKQVFTSDNYITHKADSESKEVVFETGKTSVDGVEIDGGQSLASILTDYEKVSANSYDDCEMAMKKIIANQFYGISKGALLLNKGMGAGNFYQKNENEFYSISFIPHAIEMSIESIYFPDSGVPGYSSPIFIWHFVKDSRFAKGENEGWVLESFASDTSIYTDYNDRYEKLPQRTCIDKNKSFVEFKYGTRQSADKDVKALEIPAKSDGSALSKDDVKQPQLPANFYGYVDYIQDVDPAYNGSDIEFSDITTAYRIITGEKKYMVVSDEAFYIPTYAEISGSEGVGDVYLQLYLDDSDYWDDYYNVADYKGLVAGYDEYFTVVKDTAKLIDDSPYIKFTAKGQGLYYTLAVTYDSEALSMSSDPTKANSILVPTSIELKPLI